MVFQMEERRLRALEKGAEKDIWFSVGSVTGDWGKLSDGEIYANSFWVLVSRIKMGGAYCTYRAEGNCIQSFGGET